MKRGLVMIVLCGVTGFVCSYLFSPTTNPLDPYNQAPIESQESNSVIAPEAGDSGMPVSPQEPVDSPVHKIAALAPSVNDLRNEAKKNPHEVAPSLLSFARNLGARMKLALVNENKAAELFSELSECVKDSSGAFTHSARALCYSDAAELSEKYMGLQSKWNSIRESLDGKTLKRFEALNRITSPSR